MNFAFFVVQKTGTPGRWIPGTHGDAFRETMDINKPQQQRQRYKLLRSKNLSPQTTFQILSPMVFSPFSPGPCQRFQGLLGQLELRREVPMGFVTLELAKKHRDSLSLIGPSLNTPFFIPLVSV